MSQVVQIVIPVLSAIVGAALGAYSTYFTMIGVEKQKEARKRHSIGIVIQAELAHLYRSLLSHQQQLEGYLAKVRGRISGTTIEDYPSFETDGRFHIYESIVPDIGLFDNETSYGVVYCYSNFNRFIRLQRSFIDELGGLINSSILRFRAEDLNHQETALVRQIERIIPRLAAQSQPIPFQPASRAQP